MRESGPSEPKSFESLSAVEKIQAVLAVRSEKPMSKDFILLTAGVKPDELTDGERSTVDAFLVGPDVLTSEDSQFGTLYKMVPDRCSEIIQILGVDSLTVRTQIANSLWNSIGGVDQ